MEEIDLKELFKMFWNEKIVIILLTILCLLGGVAYTRYFVIPEYKAETTLVLVQNALTLTQAGDTKITTTDLTLNRELVSTYSELIKTNTILNEVSTNLKISKDKIDTNKISVTAKEGTEVISIIVKDKNPEFSAKLANEIAKVFGERVIEIYNINNIYLLDRAEVPTEPCNINHIKDVAIFAFVGLVISCAYVLVKYMLLDETIKSDLDIENIEGLVVLGQIPQYDNKLYNGLVKHKKARLLKDGNVK